MASPWDGLFLHDLGVLPDHCFETPYHVLVVPSVPRTDINRILREKSVVAKIFKAVKDHGFGTPEFIRRINKLSAANQDLSVETMYRTAAMLVLVDQRKKLQYLVQPYVPTGRISAWNIHFTPAGKGIKLKKTRTELKKWKEQHLKQNPTFLDVFEKQIVDKTERLDSLSNVMRVIEGGLPFDSGDLLLLFNNCGTFFGGVYAYTALEREQQKMIGIRASISRLLYCHKSSPVGSEQCLVRLLGRVFYSVRCLLARMDGYHTASVQNPIGDMADMIGRLHDELRKMMLGKAPFDDTPEKITYLTQTIEKHEITIHIPTYRKRLDRNTIQTYLNGPASNEPTNKVLVLKEYTWA